LREHESELKAARVEHLFLHGPYARETAIREVSDVRGMDLEAFREDPKTIAAVERSIIFRCFDLG
jgi:hypothetical protein